jgi:hypothetical protein
MIANKSANPGFCPINSVAWADAHRQKPRPSTTLTTKSGSTPITRNEVCMKPGNASHPNMHGRVGTATAGGTTRPHAETSGAKTTLVRGFRLGYPI